ncbi:hypothetical protein D3C75_757640 [compost metagenome]
MTPFLVTLDRAKSNSTVTVPSVAAVGRVCLIPVVVAAVFTKFASVIFNALEAKTESPAPINSILSPATAVPVDTIVKPAMEDGRAVLPPSHASLSPYTPSKSSYSSTVLPAGAAGDAKAVLPDRGTEPSSSTAVSMVHTACFHVFLCFMVGISSPFLLFMYPPEVVSALAHKHLAGRYHYAVLAGERL